MDSNFFDVTKVVIHDYEIDLGAVSKTAVKKVYSTDHDQWNLKEPSHHDLHCLLRFMYYLIRSKESTNFKRKILNCYLVDFFYLSFLRHFRIPFLYICKIWILEKELLKKSWSKLVGEINFNIFKLVSRKIKFGAVLCQIFKYICLGNLSCFPGNFCLANCRSYLLKLMKNRNQESVINLLNWNLYCVLLYRENFV